MFKLTLTLVVLAIVASPAWAEHQQNEGGYRPLASSDEPRKGAPAGAFKVEFEYKDKTYFSCTMPDLKDFIESCGHGYVAESKGYLYCYCRGEKVPEGKVCEAYLTENKSASWRLIDAKDGIPQTGPSGNCPEGTEEVSAGASQLCWEVGLKDTSTVGKAFGLKPGKACLKAK